MRKLILMLLLAVVSLDVMAEWIGGWKMLGSSGGEMTLYVNPSTLDKEGKTTKIWYMKDYKSVQEEASDKYMSISFQGEYDCKESKGRTLSYIWYSGHKGSGNVIHTEETPDDWRSVVSGSVQESVFKYACDRKWWQWW